jgi:hypothetical protein
VDDQLAERLLQRFLQGQRVQPGRRDSARRGLPLADLVAVDHHHVGAASRQLASHRETREARSADQDVAVAAQRRALHTALGCSLGHRETMIRAQLHTPCMAILRG